MLDLSSNRPQVMGILNVTPDSFSDGGHFNQVDKALYHAEQLIQEGADIIDIGGESTRPGSEGISVQEELDRVIPVLQALRSRFDIKLSVDTSKPAVMQEAITAKVDMINDIYALQAPDALVVCAASDVSICLMHMLGEPRTMQHQPHYHDVVQEIIDFFKQRIEACEKAGITIDRLILDPGFGFGKSLEHNQKLLQHLNQFRVLNRPILAGLSRKSMIGAWLGNKSVSDRLHGSVAAALLAVMQGACIVRVHDVGATVDALKIAQVVKD